MHYVIEIATGDKAIAGFGIYPKETEKEAEALYHRKLSTAMLSPLYRSDLVLVIDEEGTVKHRRPFVNEDYVETIPESFLTPEPEPEIGVAD